MLPVECVVRGYLVGSGWKDYRRTGTVCGHQLPAGPRARPTELPEPLFTPSTKAELGAHDENITADAGHRARRRRALAGRSSAPRSRSTGSPPTHAPARGIILADTKFEFGLDADGALVLADEVLTPDSSRFWPADSYRTGS